MNHDQNRRHCSFCLRICRPAKVCSKCHKRAYCSRQCQADDWKPEGKGQGHKNWCKYQCGEEDIDWHMVPIPGKGLGIVAKRTIPAGYRIIVEPVFTDPAGHAAIKDLMPEDGTLMDKFDLNAFQMDVDDMGAVSLRISRVNHDCRANAATFYCTTSRVKILYAQRQILAGQEICIPYVCFMEIFYNTCMSLDDIAVLRKQRKDRLANKWNIICSADCVCNDLHVEKLIVKAIALAREVEEMQINCSVPTLKAAEDLLAVVDLISIDQFSLSRGNVCYYAGQSILLHLYPVVDRSGAYCDTNDLFVKMARVRELVSMAHNIYSAISPFSDFTKKLKDELAFVSSLF